MQVEEKSIKLVHRVLLIWQQWVFKTFIRQRCQSSLPPSTSLSHFKAANKEHLKRTEDRGRMQNSLSANMSTDMTANKQTQLRVFRQFCSHYDQTWMLLQSIDAIYDHTTENTVCLHVRTKGWLKKTALLVCKKQNTRQEKKDITKSICSSVTVIVM